MDSEKFIKKKQMIDTKSLNNLWRRNW